MRGSKEFKIILVKLFNDIHVIRAIGMNEKKNMSMIAKELAVTIGTLTISINSLVRKGYVIKERSEKDKRVVFVNLSSKGEAAFSRNEELYDQMVNSMLEDLEDNEMDILMKSLLKVNRCIKQNKA